MYIISNRLYPNTKRIHEVLIKCQISIFLSLYNYVQSFCTGTEFRLILLFRALNISKLLTNNFYLCQFKKKI